MAAPGATARKHLRVLLPFSCDSLRIPDELAEDIGAAEAHVVVPFGKGKVRRVEVGRDDDGAFLGRGWPEFAAACGAGDAAGWLLVLRHHGGGVLTVKAFDDSGCLTELPAGTTAVEVGTDSSDSPRKPQFISVLLPDSVEKMQIPSKFVQSYIHKEHLNNHTAVVLGPHAKTGQIVVEINQTGMFFAGGWSQFLEFHGVSDANCLLLRYEGNMVFTVKVFEPNGCKREWKHKDTIFQKIEQNMTLQVFEKGHQTPATSIQRCKSKNNWLGNDERTKAKISQRSFSNKSIYEIGPPAWIKKQINPNSLKKCLALATNFCDAIGLKESCKITLKTSMDTDASWQVRGWTGKRSYILLGGWKRFCKENSIEVGDICTFSIIKTTLWNVTIKRYNEKDIPSSTSTKSKSDMISCEEQIRLEESMASLTKTSSTMKFETGPPTWIRKEMKASTIENQFSLPLTFCKAIGIREPCTVTLKTSTSSTMSWQARVIPYQHCVHMARLGWRTFCQENRIKVGDICTFNIVETMLWHVDITRR